MISIFQSSLFKLSKQVILEILETKTAFPTFWHMAKSLFPPAPFFRDMEEDKWMTILRDIVRDVVIRKSYGDILMFPGPFLFSRHCFWVSFFACEYSTKVEYSMYIWEIYYKYSISQTNFCNSRHWEIQLDSIVEKWFIERKAVTEALGGKLTSLTWACNHSHSFCCFWDEYH